MVDFATQRVFKTREAVLKVDPGLALGVHTFELVVQDAAGNVSQAARVKVEIVRALIPVTPVVAVTPIPSRITRGST